MASSPPAAASSSLSADVSRLAPLDHLKTLYKDATQALPRDRTVLSKASLVAAVKAAPVPLTAAQASAAASGAPPPRALSKAALAAQAKQALAKLTLEPTKGELAAAEAEARALESLETSLNANNQRCDQLRHTLRAREARLDSLRAQLAALENERGHIAKSQREAFVMTGGHAMGHDPLMAPVSEAGGGP
jgi:hypothetical protein